MNGEAVNVGRSLRMDHQHEKAVERYKEALQDKSFCAETHNSFGNALNAVGRYEEAIINYQQALSINPNYAVAYNNLGKTFRLMRSYEEAITSHNKALLISPSWAEAHMEKGFTALEMGDFQTGFAEYEWRWKTPQGIAANRNFTKPLWLGEENVTGKTFLVHAEASLGFGDIIQFVRYATLLGKMGAAVILEVSNAQKSLVPLLCHLPGVKAVLQRGEPLPNFDLHCPLISLPLAFRTDLATIPADIPYIFPDPARQAKWEECLEPECEQSPRIGIAWSGNRKHPHDRNRSMPLGKLVPLITETGFEFYVLQKEVRSEDSDFLKVLSREITDYSDEFKDFADTAALVSLLDLVISVDTSPAHLAGAMGKPTWILLPFNAEWRWGQISQTSPWYPTARLFRQPKVGDWDSVVNTLSAKCRQLI
jgi:TPR repeat